MWFGPDLRRRAYNGPVSDFIFIAATIVFFAICVLYVKWCDTIIGPDNFDAFDADTPDATDKASEVTG